MKPVKLKPETSAPAWAGAFSSAGTKNMPAFDTDTLAVWPNGLAATSAVYVPSAPVTSLPLFEPVVAAFVGALSSTRISTASNWCRWCRKP